MNSFVFLRPCETCGQSSYMSCSRCENAWYCSTQHLQIDWGRHSQECIPRDTLAFSALAPFPEARISHTDAVFTAMLLPWDSTRPRLINMHTPGRVDAARNTTEWAIPLTGYLGSNTAFASREITRNVGGEPLRYPLRVFFRDRFLDDGSPINQTVNALTHGGTRHPWAGNIVVLKWSGSRRQGYTNMNLGDLSVIASWLLAYPPG